MESVRSQAGILQVGHRVQQRYMRRDEDHILNDKTDSGVHIFEAPLVRCLYARVSVLYQGKDPLCIGNVKESGLLGDNGFSQRAV